MADAPADTGTGPDVPAATTTTRSTRRTRRLAIIGALALVLVASAVLVGVKTTGARSGTVSTGATKSASVTLSCYRYSTNASSSYPTNIQLSWSALPSGSSTPTVWERQGVAGNFTYVSPGTNINYYPTNALFVVPNGNGRTLVVTWRPAGTTGDDTTYAELWCPKL